MPKNLIEMEIGLPVKRLSKKKSRKKEDDKKSSFLGINEKY